MNETTTHKPHGDPRQILDKRDAAIMLERLVLLDLVSGPRCGDFIIFADGTERRISHIWGGELGDHADNELQTSAGGSWYLGNGYTSFSGSLFGAVERSTLELTDDRRMGYCWFFHHDYATAGGGVDVAVPFRVYRCNEQPPS